MNDNDHEHRAYQIWDGDNRWASQSDHQSLARKVLELVERVRILEAQLERAER